MKPRGKHPPPPTTTHDKGHSSSDMSESESANYTTLTSLITLHSVELCRKWLHNNPSAHIPSNILRLVFHTKSLDIIQLVVPHRMTHEQVTLHSFELLQMAYTFKCQDIWDYMLHNGFSISHQLSGKSALHFLVSPSSPLIETSILTGSTPLVPSTNEADMTLLTSIIQADHASPMGRVFEMLPPRSMVLDAATFHRLVDLSIAHEAWDATQWLLEHQSEHYGGDTTTITQHLDDIVEQSHRLLSSSAQDGFPVGSFPSYLPRLMRAIECLLQYGGRVRDSIEFNRLLQGAMLLLARCYKDRLQSHHAESMYKLVSSIIQCILDQGVISMHLPHDLAKEHDDYTPVISMIIRSENYAGYIYLDTLIQQGVAIPPDLFNLFNTAFQPTALLDLAVDMGYKITIKTVIAYIRMKQNYIHPHDDGVIAILKRDAFSHNHPLWKTIRNQITSTVSIFRPYFQEFIFYAISHHRYDIIELFTHHGFMLPEDCRYVGWNPLFNLYRNPVALQYVIDWGISPNTLNCYDKPPLFYALKKYKLATPPLADASNDLLKQSIEILFHNDARFDVMDLSDPQFLADMLYRVVHLDNYDLVKSYLDTIDFTRFSDESYHDQCYPFHYVKSYPIAKVLVDLGFDVNAVSPVDDTTALCHMTDLSIVQLLIDHGATVNAEHGYPPLSHAIVSHNLPLVKLLLANKAQLTIGLAECQSLLELALSSTGDVETIHDLLSQVQSVDLSHAVAHTFIEACKLGSTDLMRVLIGINGGEINLSDTSIFAQLLLHRHFDFIQHHMDHDTICQLLSLPTQDTDDVLYRNIIISDKPSYDFYVKYGIDFNDQRVWALMRHRHTIKTFGEVCGAAVRFHPIDGVCHTPHSDTMGDALGGSQVPIYSCVDAGVMSLMHTPPPPDWDTIWDLIHCGANVNADDGSHFTLSLLIRRAPFRKVYRYVEKLIEQGAHVNPIHGISGDVPLVVAVGMGYWDVVLLLLRHGADVSVVFSNPKVGKSTILHLLFQTITTHTSKAISHKDGHNNNNNNSNIYSNNDSDYEQYSTPPLGDDTLDGYSEILRAIRDSPTFHSRLLSIKNTLGLTPLQYIPSKVHRVYFQRLLRREYR